MYCLITYYLLPFIYTFMFGKFKTYIEESRQEFRRVNWPSWETTVHYTVFVIGLSLAFAVFLGILDFGFLTVLKQVTLR